MSAGGCDDLGTILLDTRCTSTSVRSCFWRLKFDLYLKICRLTYVQSFIVARTQASSQLCSCFGEISYHAARSYSQSSALKKSMV